MRSSAEKVETLPNRCELYLNSIRGNVHLAGQGIHWHTRTSERDAPVAM